MSEFDEFWARLDDDLAAFPARPLIEPVPAKTTEHFTGYEIRFSGLDSYRLFGYLSVPTGPGPFPALLEVPRYGSVNHAPHYNDRLRYVVLTPMHRGQRLADSPFKAAYPGLFALGIENPTTYVYRAILADVLRAAEILAARPEVDPQRIGITGDDLVLTTAARRPVFAAARVTGPLLHDAMARRSTTGEYPLEELNDLLRTTPELSEAVARTLDVFDPVHHAGAVRARTLFSVPSGGSPWTEKLTGALGSTLDTYRLTDEDSADAFAIDEWLAERLGVEPLSRFIAEVP
ncbi:acetylxylan esterase [Actinoalloteichus hymeniacidonis]|uniref:Acetyl esterase (Deacetylase) n=1 Tax=Actinoalloteichus hymeniacidonis TaxID=340345 RepID=A0AAC9MZB7_9PSEU|nr:acetylxylan esterase [Actinoalloteichus hymeniacidonis]AOS64185.1 acetyl esterase (deacetylase) [Actinoalloteichus hymeniacidonis]MBB5907747.1 cephalosporin-C deacetylase [Actinoalloteichus hymeniacidonis]